MPLDVESPLFARMNINQIGRMVHLPFFGKAMATEGNFNYNIPTVHWQTKLEWIEMGQTIFNSLNRFAFKDRHGTILNPFHWMLPPVPAFLRMCQRLTRTGASDSSASAVKASKMAGLSRLPSDSFIRHPAAPELRQA